MSNNQAGKGDKFRPVKKEQFNKNFDSINWGKSKKKNKELESRIKAHQQLN
jgi:hypothetical protein